MGLTDNWQMAAILTDNWHLYPPPPHPDPRYTGGPPNPPSVARSTNIAQFLLELTFFSENAQTGKNVFFYLWGGGKELFSIPCYNGTEKKVAFSTIYKVYNLRQSYPLSSYKEWENLADKRTNHTFRDNEITKGERHPGHPTSKPLPNLRLQN